MSLLRPLLLDNVPRCATWRRSLAHPPTPIRCLFRARERPRLAEAAHRLHGRTAACASLSAASSTLARRRCRGCRNQPGPIGPVGGQRHPRVLAVQTHASKVTLTSLSPAAAWAEAVLRGSFLLCSIQQSAALALGRLANYNDELAEAVVSNEILPQLVRALAALPRALTKESNCECGVADACGGGTARRCTR